MVTFEQYMDALSPDSRAAVGAFYGGASADNPYGSINPYTYSGMSRRDAPGDQLYADIVRAQTQDYLNRFAPIEDFLAGQITATGTQSLQGDLDRTRSAVLGAGSNVAAQQGRAMERFGVQREADLANQNSTVSALVGGLNDTRLRDQDRRMALLTGGLGALSQKARSSQ
tara:strand:+ start:2926 stop:3435 length:510 start_codon:yes stop_codon:yes gene_type:complete